MFFPKFIYENLPYIYFLICGYFIAFFDGWAVIFSAALFYFAGCITLVTRSDYRRLDRYKGSFHHKHPLPEIIYEYLPYSYVAVATIILLKTSSSILQFFAIILMILALRNLLCRNSNRRKGKSV